MQNEDVEDVEPFDSATTLEQQEGRATWNQRHDVIERTTKEKTMNDNNEQLPSPEERQRAVQYALKNSKWTADFANHKTTDEEKAQERLEAATVEIFKTCAQVKTLDIEHGGTYDEAAMGRLALSLWMQFTEKESREGLRFMLSTVCTGAMLEAVAEL